MRHSSELISNLLQMRKDGLTLTEIKSKIGLSKSTIFHHIKTIPKSDFLSRKLIHIQLLKNRAIADKRRGKSIKSYSFLRPERWTPNFVNLIAHFKFDGDLRHTASNYNNRNEVLIDRVKQDMKELLSVGDFKTYINKKTGVFKICYFNVELAAYIKLKSQELLDYIPAASFEEKRSFLKAFFDDEGCVTFEKKKRIVRGYQKSLDILKVVQGILKDFKIESKVDGKYFAIIIGKRNNLLKFQQLINFSPGLRVNGNRSNSIWKKDLEKREILKMATDSYRN